MELGAPAAVGGGGHGNATCLKWPLPLSAAARTYRLSREGSSVWHPEPAVTSLCPGRSERAVQCG